MKSLHMACELKQENSPHALHGVHARLGALPELNKGL